MYIHTQMCYNIHTHIHTYRHAVIINIRTYTHMYIHTYICIIIIYTHYLNI